MIKTTLLLVFSCFALYSCTDKTTENSDQKNDSSKKVKDTTQDSLIDSAENKPVVNQAPIEWFTIQSTEELNPPSHEIIIRFDDFILAIDKIMYYDVDDGLQRIQKDTAVVYLELGGSAQNKKVSLYSDKYSKGALFIRYENSITIMDEGPHCDLMDWKHYYSPWIAASFNNNKFTTPEFEREDHQKFIDVDLDELKEAVAVHCGEGWAEKAKDIESYNDYPSGVGMSHVFIKVQLKDDNGASTEKIISFEVPMGC